MSARRRVTIRIALLLLAGVVMLPFLVMAAFTVYRAGQQAEALAHAAVLDAAYTRAQMIESELEAMREFLDAIAERPQVRSLDPSRCDPLLQELRSIDSRVANIGLRTRAGESMCLQSAEGVLAAAEIREVEWFREAIAVEGFRASNAFSAKTLARWVVAFSHTVRGPSGAPAAVLSAAMPLERFAEWLSRGKPLEGAVTLVVDRAGAVMFHSLDNRAWLGKKVPERELIDRALSAVDGNYRARGLDGVERSYGFATVPSAGWKIIVGIPTEVMSAAVRRQIVESVLVWGVLALLACALAFGIARSISGPIRNLRERIRAAAEGDFHLPLQPRGPAEVAQLSQEFNRMVAARRDVEADLKRSLEERTRQQGRLHGMTRRLVSLQEKERRDIARELHDRVGQNLASLSINLARLRTEAAGPAGAARIADCAALVEATGLVIQDVLTELKPPMLASYGLLDALRWHAAEFSRRTGIAVEVEGAEPAERLDPATEMALFRIAQGALNNVAQHARAKRAWISLEHTGRRLRFEIRDDGEGFDAERALAAGRWGLTSMRERAEAIDGALRIESSSGAGTRVIVELDAA